MVTLVEKIIQEPPVEKRNLVLKEFSTDGASPNLKIFRTSYTKIHDTLRWIFGNEMYLELKSKKSILVTDGFFVICIFVASIVLIACMIWLVKMIKKSSISASVAENEVSRGFTVATINI